jgi:Domain of unknown function (DUF6916)
VFHFSIDQLGGQAMSTSRRDFLKKGTIVALAAGVPLSLVQRAAGNSALASPVAPALTSALSKAAFESQLHTNFLVAKGSSRIALKLVSVTDLMGREKFAGKEGFSLIFRGELNALEQNTYKIEHQRLGEFSFLMVPVMGSRNKTQYYEAIINRLHP